MLSKLVLACLFVILLSRSAPPQEARAENYPTGPGDVTATCTADPLSRVRFSWPVDPTALAYKIEVSSKSYFRDDAIVAMAHLEPDRLSVSLDLNAGGPYYWRRSIDRDLWSAIGAFSVCADPLLLWSQVSCNLDEPASVDFRWASRAAPVALVWLDIGFDGAFPEGSFIAEGPFPGAVNSHTVSGLPADLTTVFRVTS